MDVLIVGGDSAIGSLTGRHLAELGLSVAATTRRRDTASAARPFLDLDDDAAAWSLPAADICVLAAARARLADCEADPEGSRRVNATAPALLARRMADRGSLVILFSTNQVFDGTRALRRPDDARAPLTSYGRQKADAEAAIQALGTAGAVLRLTKVLTAGLPLVQNWLKSLGAGQPIAGFDDMHLAPVRSEKVAEALALIAQRRASGMFQASGDRDIPYSDFARWIADACGADPALVLAESGERAGIAAAMRPLHTTLDTGSLAALGWEPETSRDAIARYCRETLGLRSEV